MDTRDLPDQEAREFYEEQKRLDLRKKTKGYRTRMYREDKAFYTQSGLSKNLGNLPVKDKQELIIKYHIDGGVLFGKRLTKGALCGLLRLDQKEFEKMYRAAQSILISSFDTREKFRDQITLVISKVIMHVDDNRARAVMHADLLENELERVADLLNRAHEMTEENSQDRLIKSSRINQLMRYMRTLSGEKIELLKVMFSGTDSVAKLLSLFSGSAAAKNRFSIEPTEEENSDQNEYVDLKTAIKLLESSGSADVLPVQDNDRFNTGPRNPAEGFEELENSVEEKIKSAGTSRNSKV